VSPVVWYGALQVVYMDQPSTGLDTASRDEPVGGGGGGQKDRAIILTSEHTCHPSLFWKQGLLCTLKQGAASFSVLSTE